MLVTNGKKIVLLPHDSERMQQIAKDLKSKAKDVLGIKSAKFSMHEEPYPHLINEEDLSFQDIKKLCFGVIDVQFRAIGNESIQMPETKMKDIKHIFSPEEKANIAESFCNEQYELEKVTAEAKAVAKNYKSTIDAHAGSIAELSAKHRQGYEIRNTECHLHLDFETNVRIYTDVETGDVLHTEPMEPVDRQMRIEFKNGEFEQEVSAEVEEENFDDVEIDPEEEDFDFDTEDNDPFA